MNDKGSYNDATPYPTSNHYYIAAAWGEDDIQSNNVPTVFTVGDNTEYEVVVNGTKTTYSNVPLDSNTEYSIFVRYDIENEDGVPLGDGLTYEVSVVSLIVYKIFAIYSYHSLIVFSRSIHLVKQVCFCYNSNVCSVRCDVCCVELPYSVAGLVVGLLLAILFFIAVGVAIVIFVFYYKK